MDLLNKTCHHSRIETNKIVKTRTRIKTKQNKGKGNTTKLKQKTKTTTKKSPSHLGWKRIYFLDNVIRHTDIFFI